MGCADRTFIKFIWQSKGQCQENCTRMLIYQVLPVMVVVVMQSLFLVFKYKKKFLLNKLVEKCNPTLMFTEIFLLAQIVVKWNDETEDETMNNIFFLILFISKTSEICLYYLLYILVLLLHGLNMHAVFTRMYYN